MVQDIKVPVCFAPYVKFPHPKIMGSPQQVH